MNVIVVGVFANFAQAQLARGALVHAGVPEAHMALEATQTGGCTLGVRTQSSLERERIKALLQRNGAACIEQPDGL
jgi:hypothetical protein